MNHLFGMRLNRLKTEIVFLMGFLTCSSLTGELDSAVKSGPKFWIANSYTFFSFRLFVSHIYKCNKKRRVITVEK